MFITTCIAANAFNAVDEHFWRWKQTPFALEMNNSSGDERIENSRLNFGHSDTCTQIATSNFQTKLMLSSLSKTGAFILQRFKGCVHNAIFGCIKLVFKAKFII